MPVAPEQTQGLRRDASFPLFELQTRSARQSEDSTKLVRRATTAMADTKISEPSTTRCRVYRRHVGRTIDLSNDRPIGGPMMIAMNVVTTPKTVGPTSVRVQHLGRIPYLPGPKNGAFGKPMRNSTNSNPGETRITGRR